MVATEMQVQVLFDASVKCTSAVYSGSSRNLQFFYIVYEYNVQYTLYNMQQTFKKILLTQSSHSFLSVYRTLSQK